ALIVWPPSRSKSIESRIWSCFSRSWIVPVHSSNRSDKGVLPLSMCAMMQKFRVNSIAMEAPLCEHGHARSIQPACHFERNEAKSRMERYSKSRHRRADCEVELSGKPTVQICSD